MSSSKVSKFCSNSALVFGIFFKFEISGFPAGFSFRQALSRLALLTLLCFLAATFPRVQARRRFVLLREKKNENLTPRPEEPSFLFSSSNIVINIIDLI